MQTDLHQQHGRSIENGSHSDRRVVAVIGAGASGILTARALLCSASAYTVVLIERDVDWRVGPAYGTTNPCHLLNVPAGKLSVDEHAPGDFVNWARSRVDSASHDAFLPRSLFGEYLREALVTSAACAARSTLSRITGRVVRLVSTAHGIHVEMEDGQHLDVDHVVLALGNPSPRAIGSGQANVINDPWSPDLDMIADDDPVVLVGSGLTAIDIALQLCASGRRRAPIEMVSRRGLLPAVHAPRSISPSVELVAPRTARSALRTFRKAVDERQGDWRAVFDDVRGRTNEFWAGLSEQERSRLLRHVARYWEVHRHRIPPQVAAHVERLVDTGFVHVRRGTVDVRAAAGGDHDVVAFADGAELVMHDAMWVVNCTGPHYELRSSDDPLIRHLLDNGIARSGPCGLGLDIAADGQLIDISGRPSDSISVIGPLRRGAEWETTAIPEIRRQATDLAIQMTRREHRSRTARRNMLRSRGGARSVTPTRLDLHLTDTLDALMARTDLEASAARLRITPGSRAWTRLESTADFDAWLIAWGPSSEVGMHDHGDSHGAFRVLRGSLVESYPKCDGFHRWHQRILRPGHLIEIPPDRIHNVANPASRPALSLHVYSPPLTTMNFLPAGEPLEVRA
ncbi:MAG: FAD/NAD(P)-binding protein [Acidimicrobiia bacterium]